MTDRWHMRPHSEQLLIWLGWWLWDLTARDFEDDARSDPS